MTRIERRLGTRPMSRYGRWLGLVAAASGMFLAALDITVNVALPDITASFGTDAVTIQWIIIFYVGASTALQLGLGGAADAFGLKRMFVIGLVVYTVAVVAIGLAQSLALVFGLRVLQAFGNGLLMALAPAIVTRLFPPDFRGRALGIMAALGTFGMMTGSLGGGLLVDEFGWRAIFLGRLPICLAAIAFSVAFLRLPPDTPDATSDGAFANGRPRLNFDVWGAAALFVAVSAFVLALALGGREGWTQPYVPALFVAAVAAFAAFVAIERRAARPALDLSIFKNRALAAALAVSILAMLSTFVNWFILPFMVVDAMGASASVWGALLLSMTIANTLGSPLGGWLSDRWSPAYTITGGLATCALAMASLATLDAGSGVARVAVGLVAVGVGTGLFQSANANLIMGAMPPGRLGMGGGVMGLTRGLGTVSSVAIMGGVFAARETARGAETGADAFTLAFQDTYLAAVAIGVAAVAASLGTWGRGRTSSSALNHPSKD